MIKEPELTYQTMIETFREKQAEIYENDPQSTVWLRSMYQNGCIWAYKGSHKDSPVITFATMIDGALHQDRHENLISLFLKAA